jgi:hypothetical protein
VWCLQSRCRSARCFMAGISVFPPLSTVPCRRRRVTVERRFAGIAPTSSPNPKKNWGTGTEEQSQTEGRVGADPCLIPEPAKQCHSERGAATDHLGFTAASAPTEESGRWAHRRVGHDLLREKPRSTGCTVAEPDSSVGAPAPARGEGSRGRLSQNDSDPSVRCFPDPVFNSIQSTRTPGNRGGFAQRKMSPAAGVRPMRTASSAETKSETRVVYTSKPAVRRRSR